MTVQEVFELRKAGRIEEAYNTIIPMYKQHHGYYTQICMFWCGHDMAKLLLERGDVVGTDKIMMSLWNMYAQIDDKDGMGRRSLLYLAMQLAQAQHKQLSLAAINKRAREVSDSFRFAFVRFIDWYGLNSLTADDWQASESNGHPLPSRGQKIATIAFREVKDTDDVAGCAIALNCVEEALRHNPKNRLLQRSKAYLLVKTGNKAEAAILYRHLARWGKEGYVFSELAQLTDDIAEKIALLVRSISLQRNEAFRQKDRLCLAELLAAQKPQNAKYELDCCIKHREAMKQAKSKQLRLLESQLAAVQPATEVEQRAFYEQVNKYFTEKVLPTY